MYQPEKKLNLIEDITERIMLNLENQEISKEQAQEIARRWLKGLAA